MTYLAFGLGVNTCLTCSGYSIAPFDGQLGASLLVMTSFVTVEQVDTIEALRASRAFVGSEVLVTF